jgi:uncharacterized protein (TIGR02246 family)
VISEKKIYREFDAWNSAIQTGNPDAVVSLYDPDAVLTPSFSDIVRNTPDEIRDYFRVFLAKKPRARIDESNVRMGEDWAVNSGIYTFFFGAGEVESARARYTFVYKAVALGTMNIIAHHSSALPTQYKQWFESEAGLTGM